MPAPATAIHTIRNLTDLALARNPDRGVSFAAGRSTGSPDPRRTAGYDYTSLPGGKRLAPRLPVRSARLIQGDSGADGRRERTAVLSRCQIQRVAGGRNGFGIAACRSVRH